MAKTQTLKAETVRQSGLKVLGSFIGPTAGRRAFLKGKIDSVSKALDNLAYLPNHHALLLLRLGLQQRLRHLLRTLSHRVLIDLWDLDWEFLQAARRIRGDTQKTAWDYKKDRHSIQLPIKLGGRRYCRGTQPEHLCPCAIGIASLPASTNLSPMR